MLKDPINSLMRSFIIKRAVKTTFQMLYDKGLFVDYENSGEVQEHYQHIELNEKRRTDLDPLNDMDIKSVIDSAYIVIQWFNPKTV